MITRLGIRNFKAFTSLDLKFAQLTLLTGLNNTGKSSVIQALLLAQVAIESDSAVPLNGPFGLGLGEALDVLSFNAVDQTVGIDIEDEVGVLQLTLTVPEHRTVTLDKTESRRGRPRDTAGGFIGDYLSAERLGPRDYLDIAPFLSERPSVGHRGQYVAYVLALLDRDRTKITGPRLHPNTAELAIGTTVLPQTEAWLSSIAGQIQIDANWPEALSVATLRFKDDPGPAANWKRAANVGFGFSYALPVVVAGFSCRPGYVLVVENPEAHLHPAGQSMMGQFLARVAASGIQVVIETHSDHLVNGIRLAAAEQAVLSASDVVFHFFGRGLAPSEIRLSAAGAMSSWPAGFFDQIELDLGRISRVRRNV